MNFSHEKQPGKNFTGLAIVIVLHVIVAWGIVNGLGKRMITKMTEAVETKIIEDVKPPPPPDVPPPPPPPEMNAPPPPFIPPVEVQVQQPQQQTPIAVATTAKPATTELARPSPPAPPSPSSHGVRAAAVVDFEACKPEYPQSSSRNEETGTTTMSVLIGVDGRIKDSKLIKSSGSRALDKAMLQAFARCQAKPAMVDGKPEQSWALVQYVWKLE